MRILGQDRYIKKGEKVSWKDSQTRQIKYQVYEGSPEVIMDYYERLKDEIDSGTSGIFDIGYDTTKLPASLTYSTYLDGYFYRGQDMRGYTVEVSTERTSEPIEQNPYFRNALSPNIIADIKKAMEDGTVNLTDWAKDNGDQKKYTEYVNSLLQRQTSYIAFLFNVKKTVSYARYSDISISQTRIGTIITESQLPVSGKIKSILPAGWTYLKCPATITESKGVFNVSQEFLGGQNWNANLYNGEDYDDAETTTTTTLSLPAP